MPRSKIPSVSRASRPNNSNSSDEQSGVNPSTSSSEVNVAPVAATPAVAPKAQVAPQAQSKSEVKPEPKKMEVVKTDSRKNLVPINLDDEIRKRAYELYQKRGTAAGSEAEDWFTAEREVRQRYRQQSA